MHGIVMVEFEAFVQKNFGEETWTQLCEEAQLGGKIYLPVAVYPDEDIMALVDGAVQMTGKPASELLGLFGEHLVPPLIDIYVNLQNNDWTALDLLQNVEKTIHRIVRTRQPEASPPELRCERVSETEVSITYQSPRGLCDLAKGLTRGVATFFDERIDVEESSCMQSGDNQCLIWARKRD